MIVLLQARIGSTRLPGKALFSFFQKSMVQRAIAIAQAIPSSERVILTTGDRHENLALSPDANEAGAEFFVGSEENVLGRFCAALGDYEGEYCVRITCDNYLAQPKVIESLYQAAVNADADYAYISPLSHFAGEIIRCEALRSSLSSDYSEEAKEHVTWDIRNSDQFKVYAAPSNFCGLDHSQKITLDTLQDLITMKQIERENPAFSAADCLDALVAFQS